MTERVFVLESDNEKFSYWGNPEFGLGAQLEALEIDGDSVEIERLTSAADLRLVANAVKISQELPARALVLANIKGSDLERNPTVAVSGNQMVLPEDFEEGVDPQFIWPEGDDSRPLDPYGRLIAARLIQRNVPSIQFGADVTRDFGRALANLNRMIIADGQPIMSIVDATNTLSRQYPTSRIGASFAPVSGADVVIRSSVFQDTAHVDLQHLRVTKSNEQIAANQIGAVASLLDGEYPEA